MTLVMWSRLCDRRHVARAELFAEHAHLQSMTPDTERTDESLVLGAQAGDEASMALLLERYRPMLYAQAPRLVGHAADCDDVVQDTFLVALCTWAICAIVLAPGHGWPLF